MHKAIVASLGALATLGACAAPSTPAAPARQPTQAVGTTIVPAPLRNTNTDPARTAINMTDAVFGRPASVAGRPAVTAQAVSYLEWLSVALPADQRWTEMSSTVFRQMQDGRDEVRAALGIPATTTTNAAITALDTAAAALETGNRASALAALGSVTGPAGAERAFGVLNALPRFPRAAGATSAAQGAMGRIEQNAGR